MILELIFSQFIAFDGKRYDVNLQAVDGDTITAYDVQTNKKVLSIRLSHIDAPEKEQLCLDENNEEYQCGLEAFMHLKNLVEESGDNIVCVDTPRPDKYNKRAIGICYGSNNNLNLEMIKSGFAVRYYASGPLFKQQEIIACQNKKNIWRGKFMIPQEWRKHRGKINNLVKVPCN